MIDEHWKEPLRDLDDLKQSVQNATYEQKDPLLIYKFESFELFKGVLDKVSKDVLSFLLKAHIPLRENTQQPPVNVRQESHKKTDLSNMRTQGRICQLRAESLNLKVLCMLRRRLAGMIHALAEAGRSIKIAMVQVNNFDLCMIL